MSLYLLSGWNLELISKDRIDHLCKIGFTPTIWAAWPFLWEAMKEEHWNSSCQTFNKFWCGFYEVLIFTSSKVKKTHVLFISLAWKLLKSEPIILSWKGEGDCWGLQEDLALKSQKKETVAAGKMCIVYLSKIATQNEGASFSMAAPC